MKKTLFIALILLATAGCDSVPGDSAGNGGLANPYPVIEIKVRVYLLAFAGAPSYNSTFDGNRIAAYVNGINSIYEQAGIRLRLESVRPLTVPTSEIPSFSSGESNQSVANKLLSIKFPSAYIGEPLLQVAFFRTFPISAKGLYMSPQKTAFVGEYAPNGSLNEPVVPAHELGHELSLPHFNQGGSQCIGDNLMCVGGTGIGTHLTAEQIAQMRRQAAIGPY